MICVNGGMFTMSQIAQLTLDQTKGTRLDGQRARNGLISAFCVCHRPRLTVFWWYRVAPKRGKYVWLSASLKRLSCRANNFHVWHTSTSFCPERV